LKNEKKLKKCMNALEDVKGLYTMLGQATAGLEEKREYKVMLQDIERHYQYLDSRVNSFKQNTE
jgi:uncharacterized protein involved in tolerance to divalent cations